MGSVGAGAATVGLGYTSKTVKDGDTETTPSTLNGYVEVGLGGGQKVGASFDILGDGAEEDETTALADFSFLQYAILCGSCHS